MKIKKIIQKTLVYKFFNKINTPLRRLISEKLKKHNYQLSVKLLNKRGYLILDYLGEGKDGFVFSVEIDGDKKIAKVLSSYGFKYLPISQLVSNKKINHLMLYEFEVVHGIMLYPYESLQKIDLTPKKLLEVYIEVFDLEKEFLAHGLIYWDFGYSSLNFMKNKQGQLRLIDYGGNAFLFIDTPTFEIKNARKMLVNANNEFVQNLILTHIIVFGIGKVSFKKWASILQQGKARYSEFDKLSKKILMGSVYENLYSSVKNANLLIPEGWSNLQKEIKNILKSESNWTLESADIDTTKYFNDYIEVRGYQNYNISNSYVNALNIGHSWTVSKKKYDIVFKVLKGSGGGTYLDIGSNLGMYVFSAYINHGYQATGLDYNEDYISECIKINNFLSLDCEFINIPFHSQNRAYDVVSCLGVIHHMYQRTESYGSLEKIISKLSQMTNKSLILEFPTEKDPKAAEWTGLTSRSTKDEYSLKNFLEISKNCFIKIDVIGYVSNERPVFLLEK